MSDVVTISSRLSNLDVSPQFDSYSKVVIHVSEDTTHVAGNDDGRTLEIDNPFGTQPMANAMLTALRGYQYQPYTATGALLDPAAEIGDAANMRGNYGGIYTRDRTFGRLMKADISAPWEEEINHEYQYESPEHREFTRSIDEVKASLIIANDNISAKVSKESPEGQTSFSWRMNDTSHTWYANGTQVMKVSATGLEVSGKITATSGKIGDFNIGTSSNKKAIWNNISVFGATSPSTGVYLGTDGIQLGQRFKVDTSGNVTATRLTVDTLIIGGTAVSAATLNTRANNGNSAYGWTSSNGGYCTGGVGNWYSAQTTSSPVNYFRTRALSIGGYGVIRGTPFVYNGITHYPWEYQA